MREFGGRLETHAARAAAQQAQRMTIERETEARVVIDDFAAFRRLRQHERRFGHRRVAQQFRHVLLRRDRPPCLAPMSRDTGKRIARRERFEIATRQGRAARQIVDIGERRLACARP